MNECPIAYFGCAGGNFSLVIPLARSSVETSKARFLGLYQTLGGTPMLKGRPIWRHPLLNSHFRSVSHQR